MRTSIIFSFTIFVISCRVLAKADCKEKLTQCENRRPIPRKPVCGTDDHTYPHRCALLKVKCTRNSSLTVKHKGKCKEKQPCWVDRNKKLGSNNGGGRPRQEQKTSHTDYVPECLTDGTYAPVQCHTSMGYCWCVTPHGKMIPRSTAARHQKLECPKSGKANLASSKNSTDNAGYSSKKNCDQTDKNIFVNNLVRIFKTEYNRDAFEKLHHFHASESATLEANAIRWKFATLDKDKNNSLNKSEYRDLRKLIKKVVKPRRCSRAFVRLCDSDHDSIISEEEWRNCLNIESSAGDGDRRLEETTRRTTVEKDSSGETDSVGVFPLIDRSSESEKEAEEKANDCMSDRRAASEEQKVGDQLMYVPECTPDGLYRKVQCYPSTGYCWCVLEDSGKPIPGTSVRDSDPKCDSVPQLPRPMKGCPDHKKMTFIKELMIFFEKNLTSATDLKQEDYSVKGNEKKLEKLAMLAFENFNGNRNDFLDRREWKIFRALMATSKTMKRCGRKFPRYCDANRDNKITRVEWMQCLNLQIVSPSASVSANTHADASNTKRRGPNPIESYLKDDD